LKSSLNSFFALVPPLMGRAVRDGLPGKRSCWGQGSSRAEITGSSEGAKPRSSYEKRTFFPKSPRSASVEPFLGKGHPGPHPSFARRARLPGSSELAILACYRLGAQGSLSIVVAVGARCPADARALPRGPGHLGLAALLSGRAGLPDERSCKRAGGPVGPESQEDQGSKG
jgi:hypothetical protein